MTFLKELLILLTTLKLSDLTIAVKLSNKPLVHHVTFFPRKLINSKISMKNTSDNAVIIIQVVLDAFNYLSVKEI